MLVLISILSIFMVMFSSNLFIFSLIMFSCLFYYMINVNMFYTSSLMVDLSFFVYDEMSIFMTILLFFVMFISYLGGFFTDSIKTLSFTLIFLFLCCYFVFNTLHLFHLYFFYEASLIPILYIIIKWGSYPERSISGIMMISYTLLFGVPMFLIIIILFKTENSWYLYYMSDSNISTMMSFFVFLCFAVKLPIYGLHYWLPMAHVEAPTFGSVILASILLKLGGVGLFRTMILLNVYSLKMFMLSYFMIFTVFSALVCCFQSDFKRLIAYSSVCHMMVIPFLVFSNNILSIQTLIMIMLFHGLSSSLMFMSVGILYSMYSSRQLILTRGLVLISPLFSFILVLTFFYTLSAPPFPSYIAEVYFMLSSYILSPSLIFVFIPFVMLGLVYNLNWLSSILFNHETSVSNQSTLVTYSLMLPFFMIFILTFFSLGLFLFF